MYSRGLTKAFMLSIVVGIVFFASAVNVFASDFAKTSCNVNFRTGPSTDYDIITLLYSGKKVEVIDEDGEWSKVKLGDNEGFIKSEFIYSVPEDEQDNTPDSSSVELISWSEAKNIFTIGVTASVYDVYSGKTYYVKSFSNGRHADVEPVTKDDTNILKSTYGGVWKWDPRPVWVTINGHTMAASINGMPHGGGVNNSNGMNGQVCLHFKGSTTHNGNRSFTNWHQSALMEAYYAAN